MNDTFLTAVAANISRHRLLDASDRPVVVALSGGADSVALLHALTALGYNCIAAHCNYHLRGEESDRDERHVAEICCRLGVECLIQHCDVAAYREANKGVSVEMACREIRYRWFESLFENISAQAIAVGHNADDNIETMLLNIMRGTGIVGARGMIFCNDRHIVRPMLNITRREIESYLERANLGYITDSSNLLCDLNRNRIRNILRPVIDETFPDAAAGMTSTLDKLRENEAFYRQAIEEKRHVYIHENLIDLQALITKEPLPALLIFEWFRNEGLTRTQADNIIASASSSGARFFSGENAWTIDRGILIFEESGGSLPDDFDDCFEVKQISTAEMDYADPCTAYFDLAVVDGAPLSTRTWQTGDRMQPFGMKATKKLSDIFSNSKISVTDKKRIPLLMKSADILWIPGIRRSALYPVTPEDKSCISVRYTGRRIPPVHSCR
ncbi:MAG: tRNA lysidine(34) synthetase TilS [Paramuribaculum sp.]